MFIDGRRIVTDYPGAKFGFFSFSRFGFYIVRTDRQTDRPNHRGGADDRYTHATTVGRRQ